MMLIASIALAAILLGMSPGLTLIAAAAIAVVLDDVDPRFLDSLSGR